MRKATGLVLVSALALLAAGAAGGQSSPVVGVGAYTFTITPTSSSGGGPKSIQTSSGQCGGSVPAPAPGTSEVTSCTTTFSPLVSYPVLAGTVSDSAGASGSFSGTNCTSTGYSGSITTTIVVGSSGSSARPTTVGTTTSSLSCSFELDFGQAGTVLGSFNAEDDDDLGACTQTSSATMTFASGTGSFAGLVSPPGGISYNSGPTAGQESGGSCQFNGGMERVAGLLERLVGSRIRAVGIPPIVGRVDLSKGAYSLGFEYPAPGVPVSSATDGGLRIVTKPKIGCTASATQGSSSVKLGSATANTKGFALMTSSLHAKLSTGSWTLAVACGSVKGKTSVSIE